MRLLMIGLALSICLGLVGCTTAAPILMSTATVPPPVTDIPATNTLRPANTPIPTATSIGTVTALPAITEAPTRIPAATATSAPTSTPAATVTSAASPTAALVYITYRDFEIVPAQTTIKVGTQVVFLIKGGLLSFHQPYNFTAPNVFEAPANLGDGASFTYTFREVGTVTLLCGYHSDMRATLIVEP